MEQQRVHLTGDIIFCSFNYLNWCTAWSGLCQTQYKGSWRRRDPPIGMLVAAVLLPGYL